MMAKKSEKLSWSNQEELVFRLIDEYPEINPSKLSPDILVDLVNRLPGFDDKSAQPKVAELEDLRSQWFEERSEMEDELGPMSEAPLDDEALDEDEYRDDRTIEESDEEDLGFESYSEDDEDDEEDEIY
jgi:FeS assembly protein IscX